jgi:hypothetical protein
VIGFSTASCYCLLKIAGGDAMTGKIRVVARAIAIFELTRVPRPSSAWAGLLGGKMLPHGWTVGKIPTCSLHTLKSQYRACQNEVAARKAAKLEPIRALRTE